jgi:hypothetical protein
MKSPIKLKCTDCGVEYEVMVLPNDSHFDTKCECGTNLPGVLIGYTIGYKILERSRYEYHHNSDYPLCIVFAATAMECQLSKLFFKWKRITSFNQRSVIISDPELEIMLRKYSNIADRIEEVSKLMYPSGFSSFIKTHPDLVDIISKGYNRLDLENLSEGFQRELFWPRNRILHLGDDKYDSQSATYCFHVAELGLTILDRLDTYKKAAS